MLLTSWHKTLCNSFWLSTLGQKICFLLTVYVTDIRVPCMWLSYIDSGFCLATESLTGEMRQVWHVEDTQSARNWKMSPDESNQEFKTSVSQSSGNWILSTFIKVSLAAGSSPVQASGETLTLVDMTPWSWPPESPSSPSPGS